MKNINQTVNTDEKNIKQEKQKSRKRIFKKVLLSTACIILALLIVTTGVTYIGVAANMKRATAYESAGSEQLTLENYADGCWNIYTDKELRVMQLTDVHIGGGWMSIGKDASAVNAVAAMITAEKPDLVIVTGDLAYPIIFQAGTINNTNGARIFASLMEALGVYWTLSFGNHDVEVHSMYSYEEIIDFYSEYPHCLLQRGPESVDGYGNQVINIVNSDNVITRSLILMDSHAYVDGHIPAISYKYDNIHANQIEWYENTVKELNEKNAAVFASMNEEKASEYAKTYLEVKTSLFFHIPLGEYADAWNEYAANGYENTENTEFIYGVAGENGEEVFCGAAEDELFETILELKSTDTVFCGHDHYNTFSLDYKGIRLTYGMSVDYLAYIGINKKGSQRGCTMIEYAPDSGFSITPENYYQDKYVAVYEKETVEMQ